MMYKQYFPPVNYSHMCFVLCFIVKLRYSGDPCGSLTYMLRVAGLSQWQSYDYLGESEKKNEKDVGWLDWPQTIATSADLS